MVGHATEQSLDGGGLFVGEAEGTVDRRGGLAGVLDSHLRSP
jgi:hypothetical protein